MITTADIVGSWVQENTVQMGGGTMRIASKWSFAADRTATLATTSILEHDGRVVNENATNHAGQWSLVSDKLIVELPDHSDSPFKLSLTEAGELQSRKRGVWRRP